MPAATRSTRKPPARVTRQTRQTSNKPSPDWDLVVRQDEHDPIDDFAQHDDQDYLDDAPYEDRALESRESFNISSAVAPLRDMAEQVDRVAELFAEKLDQFLGDHPTPLPTQHKFEAVLDLVQEFKELAEGAVRSLQRNHERDVALQLRKEWTEREKLPTQSTAVIASTETESESLMTDKRARQVRDLRQWQQEADIWELFRLVLELHHNPDPRPAQQEKQRAMDELSNVHRYTSEDEIFSLFVLQDDLASERLVVKKWLERTVDHQETSLSSISQELESKTSRGKGMWQNGWMHTREKIKGEKRTRSWSNAPGGPLPHIKRKDNTQLLVTTLDPDALSRQERVLEKEDEYFERAVWITCWEMLRRGKSWGEVSDWCKKQREGWRAMSLGMATDPADSLSKANWRHMCYLASQANGSGDYEAAVYGLLGGGHSAVQKVCRTVDDQLYGYYNSALIRQFDRFLTTHFPDRAGPARRGVGDDALKDPQEQIVGLIERLRRRPETSTESIKPMKIIQSYLLADDIGSMIHTLGYAIAVADAAQNGDEHMIVRLEPFWPGKDNQPEAEIALNRQTLRISTLMSIILAKLRTGRLQEDERHAEDNVTVAYIQSLREAQNRDMIPLYASCLSRSRGIIAMARALEDFKSPSEQQMMLSLMDKYSMEYLLILKDQLKYVLDHYIGSQAAHAMPLRMLEKTDDPLYPGQRIRLNFQREQSDAQDNTIIASLQWYNMIEGHWHETFESMGLALRKCLMTGRIGCAMAIVHTFPFDVLSKRKTEQVIGMSANVMTHTEEIPENLRETWAELMRSSRSFYDLSQIVEAIEALCFYRKQESLYTGKAMKLSAAPQTLKEAKEQVDDIVDVVLTQGLLAMPQGRNELDDFESIRQNFIPEILIAYNTVLHSAGAAISRENLIQSMDLSVTIANMVDIVECFQKAGRMRELVKSFAETSKKMLILKAEGKPWRPRKDREGRDLGLWEIGPQEQQHAHGNNLEISL